MADLLYKEESYNIIGSCFTVHRKLGAGFFRVDVSGSVRKRISKSLV